MNVNDVIKTFLREKAVMCPENLFPKVKEILSNKLTKGQIKHFGWNTRPTKGCIWLVWTEWYWVNDQTYLAA